MLQRLPRSMRDACRSGSFLRSGSLALLIGWICLLAPGARAAAVSSAAVGTPTGTVAPSAPRVSQDGPSDPQELASFLDGVLGQQLSAYHIPGATVAVVKNGALFFAKGYGSADLAHATPVQADATLFRVGSVSKLFVWTAVMQLKEAGKLDLNTDVNRYLKTFQIPNTYPGKPITLARLMTHTAGFEDRGAGIFARDASSLEPLGTWLAANIPARVRPPGEVTSYSNYGAALSAYIVEQISGQPFDRYVEDHILKPLGMRHSSFQQPLPQDLNSGMSRGYSYANGAFSAQPFEAVQVWPAGSFSATATDMATFMIAHLQNGRFGDARILQDATAQEMHAQHFTNDPSDPGLPGIDWGFYEQRIDGQRIVEHGGDTAWFHSLLALVPDHNVGLFVSYNSPGGATARDELLRAFIDRYYNGGEAQPPASPLPGYADRAAKIAGSYWPTRHSETTFEKVLMLVQTATVTPTGNGHLSISLGLGSPPVDVVEVAPWQFRLAPGQDIGVDVGTIVFQTDSSGSVTAMLPGNLPIIAWQRVAWYQASGFNLLLLVVSLLLFLAALIIWPVRFIRSLLARQELRAAIAGVTRRLMGRGARTATRPTRPTANPADGAPDQDVAAEGRIGLQRGAAPRVRVALATATDRRARLGRLAHALAGVVSALFVLFVVGFMLSNPADIVYGVAPVILFVLTLGLLGAVLTVGVMVCAVLVWRERIWSRAGRIFYTLVTLAAVAFIWELAFWNLLGYRL